MPIKLKLNKAGEDSLESQDGNLIQPKRSNEKMQLPKASVSMEKFRSNEKDSPINVTQEDEILNPLFPGPAFQVQ